MSVVGLRVNGDHLARTVTNQINSPPLLSLVSLCDTEEIPNGNRA